MFLFLFPFFEVHFSVHSFCPQLFPGEQFLPRCDGETKCRWAVVYVRCEIRGDLSPCVPQTGSASVAGGSRKNPGKIRFPAGRYVGWQAAFRFRQGGKRGQTGRNIRNEVFSESGDTEQIPRSCHGDIEKARFFRLGFTAGGGTDRHPVKRRPVCHMFFIKVMDTESHFPMKDNGPIQIFHIERLCRVRQKNNGEFKPLAFVDGHDLYGIPFGRRGNCLKIFLRPP